MSEPNAGDDEDHHDESGSRAKSKSNSTDPMRTNFHAWQ